MILKKLRETVSEQAQREYLNSQVAKQNALIDYIAMMSDVDLPEDSESEGFENE